MSQLADAVRAKHAEEKAANEAKRIKREEAETARRNHATERAASLYSLLKDQLDGQFGFTVEDARNLGGGCVATITRKSTTYYACSVRKIFTWRPADDCGEEEYEADVWYVSRVINAGDNTLVSASSSHFGGATIEDEFMKSLIHWVTEQTRFE